jgi:hypothetical protein
MNDDKPFAEPLKVATLMERFERPWFIAGGWAIDLFLGRVTRHHKDVEIAIFRDDQAAIFEHLAGWECKLSSMGGRAPWHGERLELPLHEIHARRPSGEPAHLEVLLNERDGDLWRYRRDLAIARPVALAGLRSALGVPFLAPEIVLLYKSKGPRAGDEADFGSTHAALDHGQRQWLAQALAAITPGHPWLASLR